jgi:hypothetical protein
VPKIYNIDTPEGLREFADSLQEYGKMLDALEPLRQKIANSPDKLRIPMMSAGHSD